MTVTSWPGRAALVAVGVAVVGILVWWFGLVPGSDRLEARLGGTTAIGAPAVDVWTATVDGTVCTDGDPITITAAEATTRGVRDTRFVLHTMTPAQSRQAGVNGFGGARGGPPDFDEPYGSGDPLPGRYEDAVGAQVTQPCDLSEAGPVDRQSLMVVVTVGPQGGAVSELSLTHRAWARDLTTTDGQGRTVICGVEQETRGCPSLRQ